MHAVMALMALYRPSALLGILAHLLCLVQGFSDHPVLLVSLDGLSWRYTGGDLANTSNLDYIASTGVKAKWMRPIQPVKTWPIHQTYMTGLYAETHGIVSNNFWDPLFKEKFVLQYDCSNFDPKFYNSSEPLWLTVQKRGGKSGVHFWPGYYSYPEKPSYTEKPECFVDCSAIKSSDLPRYRNKTRQGWPPYIHCFANQSLPYKNRIDKILNWMKSDDPPKFVALYVNEPDSSGHGFGLFSGHYKRAVEKMDKEVIGYLIERLIKAELFDKVNLVVVSDHGMVSISSSRSIYLSDFVNPDTFTMSEAGVAGHLWPRDRVGLEDEIYQNLTRAAAINSHFSVIKRDDIDEKYHWKDNRRIPPIYVKTELGWTVHQIRPAVITNYTSADHGWYPVPGQERLLGPVFFARGPAFKRDYESQNGLNVIDVYPLLCHLLGITPLPNNGSLDNMKEILADSSLSNAMCNKIFGLCLGICAIFVFIGLQKL
ncbi:ectonucleotide pyrophosphatase/phosphodiesterase family member 5 [Nematostella vectensis]|uniref:ectonucleotide pyrophosphatase/phosphodiesterase family member 5 n=1 Tax=Nematostella vectensis TaxID=45351 RepID=UPI002077920E|nr:ectonucleotide pyrophosphatase/phosphodiesterase family member 5 [Nematostella vectensis]